MTKVAGISIPLGLLIVAVGSSAAQSPRFPGLNPPHKKILLSAKRSLSFPLPTWLPTGFKLDSVRAKLGAG